MNERRHIDRIGKADERTLRLYWNDGRRDDLDVVFLRKRCPCAACIDEWTRKPILDPESVKDTVRPTKIESVGRYALSIRFSDGHGSGYYTFDYLDQLSKIKNNL